MDAGEIVRVSRGLYALSGWHQPGKVDPFVLAQRICSPSYISFEMALWYHGWIPEAVHSITSASRTRDWELNTPFGHFSFIRSPQRDFAVAVERVYAGHGSFLLASPLKALAEYVYVHECNWDSAHPVLHSLRVDEHLLSGVKPAEINLLLGNYSAKRIRRFLEGLRMDLA